MRVLNNLGKFCLSTGKQTIFPIETTMGPLSDSQNFFEGYVQAFHTVFEIITLRVQKQWMFFDFIFYFSKAKRIQDEAVKIISEQTNKMVQLGKSKYLEQIENKQNSENGQRKDLISYLDILIESSMTDEGSLFTDTQLCH